MEKYLVEECPYLAIGAVKQDLQRSRNKESNITGVIKICYDNAELICNYWFEHLNNSTFFAISVNGHAPQRILISERELQFGTRNYFVCDCRRQANKLYLPSGKTELKCRACYGLRYELSTINRSSSHGKFMYLTNRTIKLANQRADMNRIIYKNRYTKRYQRFLKLCGQAGLSNIVQDARDLMAAIKNQ